MKQLDFPELALIAITRAMAGFGAGLLIAPRLSDDHRKTIGATLLVVGAATTIPLIAHLRSREDEPREQRSRHSRSLAAREV